MNMREKIARAIAERNIGDPDEWNRYKSEADAALEAMREPTDEMIKDGCKAAEDYGPRYVFTAMIDAAREGK